MIKRAAVIGDGAMGTVCAVLLARNGVDVRMWGRNAARTAALNATRENTTYLAGCPLPENITAGTDPAWPFEGAELVISAIPCQHMRGVWEQMSCFLSAPAISVAKGIEVDTLSRPTEILAQVCGEQVYGILSGPSIAHEVARDLPASVVVACPDAGVSANAQEALSTATFRVYTNDDLVGVELAAALKNVVALAAGIIDGLRLGDNAKAALVARGLAEISRLGLAMGARAETFAGLAGVGDLVTTCISPHGRNRTAGQHIGEGKTPQAVIDETPSVIEGIPTTRSVMALAARCAVEMPITSAIAAVLFDGVSPQEAVRALMTRELKSE